MNPTQSWTAWKTLQALNENNKIDMLTRTHLLYDHIVWTDGDTAV